MVQWVRHGRIASHRGDIPLTEEGRQEAVDAGRRLARTFAGAEIVHFLTTATRRSAQSATAMRDGAAEQLDAIGRQDVELCTPMEEPAIRNPDLFLAGRRVEMVSTPEAMAEQLGGTGLGPEQVRAIPFYPEFFVHRDRIGFWVAHPTPPGENADAVARRLMAFALSLLDLPIERPRRYVCVTHSPLMRAFLHRYLMDDDPGEPNFMESVDLLIGQDRSVVVRYRDRERTVITN